MCGRRRACRRVPSDAIDQPRSQLCTDRVRCDCETDRAAYTRKCHGLLSIQTAVRWSSRYPARPKKCPSRYDPHTAEQCTALAGVMWPPACGHSSRAHLNNFGQVAPRDDRAAAAVRQMATRPAVLRQTEAAMQCEAGRRTSSSGQRVGATSKSNTNRSRGQQRPDSVQSNLDRLQRRSEVAQATSRKAECDHLLCTHSAAADERGSSCRIERAET